MFELLTVFINVILPVFGIVVVGVVAGKKLDLQAQTLTRAAYYVFVPAFIFQAISTAHLPLSSTLRIVVFALLTHLAGAFAAGLLGRLLGRSREMIAAFIMIAVFGNIGNYGLAILRFYRGDVVIVPATLYFVVITIVAFIVCVGAAGWARGGSKRAVLQVFRTPALWAVVPALLVSGSGVELPLLFQRFIGLLSEAMIPVMLFSLGLQLREQGRVHLNLDVVIGSGIRLAMVPLLAFAIAHFIPLTPIERVAGILQAGMPTAILVAIIARENNIVAHYVTSVVIVSTLLSLVSLSCLMVFL